MIGVVIPTFNAAASLERTLLAINAQRSVELGELAVVIADDGSGDSTLEVAYEWAARSPWSTLVSPGPNLGPAAARNRGAKATDADVLVFLDSGDLPHPDWLRGIADRFRDPAVGFASWGARLVDLERKTSKSVTPADAGSGGAVTLAGCFGVRSEVFRETGGYDPSLWFGENTDLCERVRRYCTERDFAIVADDRELLEIELGSSSASYDAKRLSAVEHLLVRDADRYGSDRAGRAKLHGIGVVNATRSGQPRAARRHAVGAVRSQPLSLRAWLRLLLSLTPRVARRVWDRNGPRARF